METNNHQIVDYDVVLDVKFGKEALNVRRRKMMHMLFIPVRYFLMQERRRK